MAFAVALSLVLFLPSAMQIDHEHISDTKLMIALQKRNKKFNRQIIFADSALVLDCAGTAEIRKISQMYKELFQTTNITVHVINERFKHNKRIINIAVYGPLNLLHQFYQHSNGSTMVRGKAITRDKSTSSYLSIKTRSIAPGEIEYVVIFFNKDGRIRYGILSTFASDSYLIHAIPTPALDRASSLEQLINGKVINIKFGSVWQFDLNLIKSDLYNAYKQNHA